MNAAGLYADRVALNFGFSEHYRIVPFKGIYLYSADYRTWGTPGIRAQLMNVKTRKLEMDFVVEGNERSFHVLNAVSPAWTCSLPFANYVCDQISGFSGSQDVRM